MSYIKKINPKIIEKLNEISSESPKEVQDFLVELLVWQAESEEKGYSDNEIIEGFTKKIERCADIPNVTDYLEKLNEI